MPERPDSCPDCGTSCRHHTGTYCHECGAEITPGPMTLARRLGTLDEIDPTLALKRNLAFDWRD